jgi:hypothetical protein
VSLAARGRGARRDVLATLAIVGAFAAVAAGHAISRRLAPRPTPDRCAAMLDRYAEQQARAWNRAPPGTHLAVDAPEVAGCVRDLSSNEVACALGANSADELERCLP